MFVYVAGGHRRGYICVSSCGEKHKFQLWAIILERVAASQPLYGEAPWGAPNDLRRCMAYLKCQGALLNVSQNSAPLEHTNCDAYLRGHCTRVCVKNSQWRRFLFERVSKIRAGGAGEKDASFLRPPPRLFYLSLGLFLLLIIKALIFLLCARHFVFAEIYTRTPSCCGAKIKIVTH